MRIQVVMTLPREAVSVPLTRRTVSAALAVAGVDSECLAEVEVALSEACTNVLCHSMRGDAFEVAVNISDHHLTMDVIDFGVGFGQFQPGWSMPDPTAESGRGLALMEALTDQATFDSVSGNGWVVHLTKRLRWAPDAPAVLMGAPQEGVVPGAGPDDN